MLENNQFTLEFEVRDYECDMQSVVNNAIYQNYLEHTRHEFLKSVGINFAYLAEKGINLMVIRAEIDYKGSLRSGDKFVVCLNIERISPMRFGFIQEIYRLSDNKLMIKAKIIGTCLNERGRPQFPKEIEEILAASS